MEYLLELKNVTKLYNNDKGIENINLIIPEGKIIGIVGKSGVGKTTLLKTMINKVKKTKGEIYYYGEKLVQNFKDIVREIGYVPQENPEDIDLTVKDLLSYTMSLYNIDFQDEIDLYLRQFNLDPNSKVNTLSQGEMRILMFINAIYHKPRLLILDEITTGLDEYNKRIVKEIILRLKANNSSIILTSHDMSFINSIADSIYILKDKNITLLNKKETDHNYKLVTLTTSKYYTYDQFKLSGISNLYINNNHISFIYKKDMHTLIKFLYGFNIEDIVITNPNINDIIEDFERWN